MYTPHSWNFDLQVNFKDLKTMPSTDSLSCFSVYKGSVKNLFIWSLMHFLKPSCLKFKSLQDYLAKL